jgi:heme A synthase
MKVLHRNIGLAAALLMATLFTQVTAYAEVTSTPKTNARHSRIVGLWDVQATITNCNTGATVASFQAMHKYESGGTGQIVPSSSPTALSAHMMIWNHVANNDYAMSAKMYRFDGAGNYIGWIVLSNEISINEAADDYHGTGLAEIYNSAGALVGMTCPILVGTRFSG